MALLVLHDACGVGGDAFAFAAVPVYFHLIQLAMLHAPRTYTQFPHAVVEAFESVFGQFLPVGEIADKRNGGSVGRPFAEHPALVVAMKAEIIVCIGEAFKVSVALDEFLFFSYGIFVTPFDSGSIRLKPRVIFDNIKHIRFIRMLQQKPRCGCRQVRRLISHKHNHFFRQRKIFLHRS